LRGVRRRVEEHLLLRFTLAVTVEVHRKQQTIMEEVVKNPIAEEDDLFRLVERSLDGLNRALPN
jgi:hypothetical protein